MTVFLRDAEATHKRLYAAHYEIAAAADKIHNTIVELHAAARYEAGRASAREAIASLERARESLDAAMRDAGNGRTALMGQTGCSGECSPSRASARVTAQEPATDAPLS